MVRLLETEGNIGRPDFEDLSRQLIKNFGTRGSTASQNRGCYEMSKCLSPKFSGTGKTTDPQIHSTNIQFRLSLNNPKVAFPKATLFKFRDERDEVQEDPNLARRMARESKFR